MEHIAEISQSDAGERGMKIWQATIVNGIFCEPEVSLGEVEVHGPAYIGRSTYMVSGSIRNHVEIGRYCSIGRDVTIGSGIHDVSGFSTSPFMEHLNENKGYKFAKEDPLRRVFIGNDVWIGDKAYIMSGAIIGDGAIIGTGAIVTKSVEAFSIVVGVPGKRIKFRFEEELRDAILESEWWNCEPAELKNLERGSMGEIVNQTKSLRRMEGSEFYRIKPT